MAQSKLNRAQSRFVWMSLTPILIYLVTFVFYPFATSVYYSLWDFFWDEFVGLANYKEAIFEDSAVPEALKNTLIYAAIRIPATIIPGFFIALALNRILVGRGFMIFGFFAPYITSMVAYSAIFLYMFSNLGLFNVVLQALGLPAQPFIRSVDEALPSLALMDAFKNVGFDVLIFMAALQNIPRSLYDATSIDGASPWQTTWFVTIPLVAPTILFLVVIISIWTIQVFEPIYVLTQGGPLGSTRTVVYKIWEAAFSAGRVGYAAALSVLLFLIVGVISIVQLRIGRTKWEY
ncbi:sugar ABC transporter permease [Devosia algicola]|uniref:Sugar ABC transporter permease n=1 Tax=Devosia algicola TaxID=3026418 RepID=A0ABY7YMG1_9HYPH|nr:sugar ABC transporter permease [Devosia algicola]WDR02402.1 sugar ABC transporter permease [Devosia algicola]